ncbi:SWIM zinc finger domain-containing protein [Paenibacillus sp. J2TS4]|uniref:SWIM zinc finger family protein n=1 Tax=Paenibacillus sp. J2TS4 TaxID=2807194 RepID=UPI001B00A311|nr:SWIM zinc finger family protein [Paenibacillus sp. J2TS4]GIP34220.1 hypothetical protein J2TS4_34300 [Paenibacillus sp. J2TS4]
MKLNQIRNWIHPVILERGEAYRANGHILSVSEVEPQVYRAVVEGSDPYEVEIELSSQGEVIHTFCDCPYDQGPICKHVTAVLLEISDEFSPIGKAKPSSRRKSAHKSIKDHLTSLSKDELIRLLIRFSNEIEDVKQALELQFMEASPKESLQLFKKVIRSTIKQNSDRYGFVAYRNVPSAVTGAEKIMEKAEEVRESGDYPRAVEISFCVMHEMGDLLQACDDSSGIVGGLIEECLDFVHSASVQLENSSSTDRSILFQLVLKEALHPSLEGWNEWQLSLLESAVYLMATLEEKEKWSQLVEGLEARESSHSSYFFENAAQLRYRVIDKFEGGREAQRYLHEHLDITAFRKIAIEDAIKNQEFDHALELAEQGERKDAREGYRGLVDQWKKYRYDIYKLTHQVVPQIKLAEEFAVAGDYQYYLSLKELYSEDEWPSAYKDFLDKLEANSDMNWNVASLYTRVLIEEGETARLMDYVRKHNRAVLEFYPHLVDKFAEEVFLVFTQIISEDIAQSANRKSYRKACGTIRVLIKAGGAAHARKIVERLREAYPNRPALLDELQKIKLD